MKMDSESINARRADMGLPPISEVDIARNKLKLVVSLLALALLFGCVLTSLLGMFAR